MAERTVQVTEQMADFIQWANDKGQEAIEKMVADGLADLRAFDEKNRGMQDEHGFRWDKAMEPNDGVDQYKHGGDCNKCKRGEYCLTQCRPNKVLKRMTTPLLYQKYLEDCPEVAAKEAAKTMTPEDVINMVQ